MSSRPKPSGRTVESIVGGADRPLKESTPPPSKAHPPRPTHGTPRDPSVPSLGIGPKHPRFAQKMTQQTDNKYVEVGVEEWMDAFVPGDNPTEEQLAKFPKYTTLRSVGKRGTKLPESTMYAPLCTDFNKVLEEAGSPLVVKDVSSWPESGLYDMKPDLVFYRKDTADRWALPPEVRDKVKPATRGVHVARCAWAWMEVVIEIKRREKNSGFCFSQAGRNIGFLRDSDVGKKARAQHAHYATEGLLRQHRLRIISIYIASSHLRAFSWDRNGVVATVAINMKKNPRLTNTLLWRISRANAMQLGHDPTAQLAGPEDLRKLSLYDPQGPGSKYLEEYHRWMLDHQEAWPIHKVECEVVRTSEDEKPATKAFLIGQLVAGHHTPTGRATRGYVAYDIEEDRLCFLKDQWRTNARGCHPELETYARLKKYNVTRVATAIAGGDVDGGSQRTVSQIFMKRYRESQGIQVPAERIHTRIVLREIGRPLDQYANSIDLIRIAGHALYAHKQAWEKAGVLHRDVSVGNIMIDITSTGKPVGFLNDWDLAKYKQDLDDPSANACHPFGISGTWPFLSALSLLYPRKISEVADDQESIIYVLLYCAFRFHLHAESPKVPADADIHTIIAINAENSGLADVVHNLFYNDSLSVSGYYMVGKTKQKEIGCGEPPIQLQDQNSPLARLLQKCYQLLKKHYQAIDYDALQGCRLPKNQVPAAAEATIENIESPAAPAADPPEAEYLDQPFDDIGAPPVDFTPPSPAASSRSSGSRAARVLDTHDELWKLFCHAFKDDAGKSVNTAPWKVDKKFDHFNGLQPVVQKPTALPTGTVTGVKRSSTEAGLDSTGSTPNLTAHNHGRQDAAQGKRAKKEEKEEPTPRVTRAMAAKAKATNTITHRTRGQTARATRASTRKA